MQFNRNNPIIMMPSKDEEADTKEVQKKFKDPKKCNWKENYGNPSLSGIEFRSATHQILNFITIQHDEVLENKLAFRIAIKVEDDGTFVLPQKQTFEEMIQAKRRQQMLLYGAGNATSNSAVLSGRAARRVAAAARRQSALTAAINRAAAPLAATPTTGSATSNTNITPASNTTPTTTVRTSSSSSSRRRRPGTSSRSRNRNRSRRTGASSSGGSRRRPPLVNATEPQVDNNNTIQDANTTNNTTPPSTPSSLAASLKDTAHIEVVPSNQPLPSTSGKVLSSMKELYKHNPMLNSVNTKEIRMLLKSAPPGASIVLSNGTVIKKSRRGGARVGAGRKRSRPLPNGQEQLNQTSSSRTSTDSNPADNSTNNNMTISTNSDTSTTIVS